MGILNFLFGNKKDNLKNNAVEDLLETVEVLPGLSMPKAFALYWDEIQKTKLEYIEIKTIPADDLSFAQSKFGHFPCLPENFDYPKDAAGKYMYPLAQLNFKDFPPLHGYPDSGLLQFYISAFDDLHGLDFDEPQTQKNFRILFFEDADVKKHQTDFSFLKETMKNGQSPVNRPYALAFKQKEEYVGLNDVRYDESGDFTLLKIAEKYPDIESNLSDSAYDIFHNNGHKIGGYAYFTQSDPRHESHLKEYILLFQLDSDDEIIWGDVGVANFFIHPDDLAKKDFSKVMYNWDCF